ASSANFGGPQLGSAQAPVAEWGPDAGWGAPPQQQPSHQQPQSNWNEPASFDAGDLILEEDDVQEMHELDVEPEEDDIPEIQFALVQFGRPPPGSSQSPFARSPTGASKSPFGGQPSQQAERTVEASASDIEANFIAFQAEDDGDDEHLKSLGDGWSQAPA